MNKKFLIIIPARAGSKRLKDKNILDLNGKPLISWSIEAALNLPINKDIVVSSDSDRVLNIARQYNVKTIKRPKHLADDNSSTIDVVLHTIEQFKKCYDYIVLLQPTSPLRTQQHIEEAIDLLEKHQCDAVVSVCEVDHPIQWNLNVPDNLDISQESKSILNKRSQELGKTYRLNGAIYIVRTSRVLKEKSFFLQDKISAYIMQKGCSIDIDDMFDFNLANCIMKFNKKDNINDRK
ncbi:MAG: acylneuraminate cytidylyltransferase family protein [Campylobacterota bacterium]|nr:acylneuraminate cytidylyltransferase family protein [Campylobacterota bacterium]